jgi:membrane protein DedA with SNARE-associated domain
MVGGAMGLSARRFILWDGLGLLVAVPATLALGYFVGQPLVDGMYWGLQRTRIVVAGLSVIFAALWLRRILLNHEDD